MPATYSGTWGFHKFIPAADHHRCFVNLTFTILAIMTVDKFGRKPLMIIGALGMAVSMIALGFAFIRVIRDWWL